MVLIHNHRIKNINISLQTAFRVRVKMKGNTDTGTQFLVLRFIVSNPDFECPHGGWTNIPPTIHEDVIVHIGDTILINGNRFEFDEISDYEADKIEKNLNNLITLEELV